MARGPEGKIQDAVLRYAKAEYNAVYKKNEVGRYFVASGWPDVAFYPGQGRVFFVEFKAPGKEPTPLQQNKIDTLRALGYSVYVVDDVAEGKKVIDFGFKP